MVDQNVARHSYLRNLSKLLRISPL